jgi:hypothetical protein
MAKRKKKALKVEDVQDEQEVKSMMSFPEACIVVTTISLVCGIALILFKTNAVFGLG